MAVSPTSPPTADSRSPNQDRAGKSASPKAQVSELKDLVVAYAKQETVNPMRNLTRFVAWGTAGAMLLSIGGVFLILAIVRVLQTETTPHLTGNLSWVPYTGGILFALVVAVIAVSRIAAKSGKRGRP